MKKIKIKYNYDKSLSGNIVDIQMTETKKVEENSNIFIKLIAGAIIGFVNGFWGGGGGMLCVPILTQVIRLEDKKAHATTLLIMLPLSIASLIVYIIKGSIQWVESINIGLGFVLGGILGALILKKISNQWLSLIFSVVIVYAGVKMLLS